MKHRFLRLTSLAIGVASVASAACSSTHDDAPARDDGGDASLPGVGSIDASDTERDAGEPTDSSPSTDAATTDGATTTGATHTTGNMLSVDGTMRTYDLTVPASCTTAKKVPLVFLFHADDGRGADMYTGFPLEAAAAAAGDEAVFVYPNGLDDNENGSAWNIYDDPGDFPYTKADPSGNDDVDFFDAMVGALAATPCVDSSKVWITGFSNGGYMVNQIARWRASVVKAVAPQSGGPPAGSTTPSNDYSAPNYCVGPTGAVPTMIIHGQADDVVDPGLAQQATSYWDMANSCADNSQDCSATTHTLLVPPATPSSAVDPSPCVASSGCNAGAPVVFCFIPGMGHQIWASAPSAIWGFFSAR